ncbi:MAG: Gfo/Idh/MocA family oxidoreductase [Balneolaceae bacterium]|nr:Gfo/Idh/MocA family oxidoreductase [Balneolaceae bacterium]
MKKIRFGVISTAKIGIEKVIPAIQNDSERCEVTAISSRNVERAQSAANELSIPKAYGSYEELLDDPEIDVIYNPLPNHLHVPWSIKALKAGKHVLCEKPIALNADEARKLKNEAQKYPDQKISEAFMYRQHPRWKRTVELIRSGEIGELRAVHSFFSYYNDDPDNVRNKADIGGGGLMDIGCYSISLSRLLFDSEPIAVHGELEYDPEFKIDRLASGLLWFENGTSVFTCSTQCFKDQYVKVYGTKGKIEMDWPFNPDFTKTQQLHVEIGNEKTTEKFGPCDHFALQADAFAASILEDGPVPVSLEDSIKNMEVIDAMRS